MTKSVKIRHRKRGHGQTRKRTAMKHRAKRATRETKRVQRKEHHKRRLLKAKTRKAKSKAPARSKATARSKAPARSKATRRRRAVKRRRTRRAIRGGFVRKIIDTLTGANREAAVDKALRYAGYGKADRASYQPHMDDGIGKYAARYDGRVSKDTVDLVEEKLGRSMTADELALLDNDQTLKRPENYTEGEDIRFKIDEDGGVTRVGEQGFSNKIMKERAALEVRSKGRALEDLNALRKEMGLQPKDIVNPSEPPKYESLQSDGSGFAGENSLLSGLSSRPASGLEAVRLSQNASEIARADKIAQSASSVTNQAIKEAGASPSDGLVEDALGSANRSIVTSRESADGAGGDGDGDNIDFEGFP